MKYLIVNADDFGGGSGINRGTDTEACRTEVVAQFQRFRDLTGAMPTHLDAHHKIHRRDNLLHHCGIELIDYRRWCEQCASFAPASR